jgi:predicted DNA-binding antitoxin AbrB/MazE fold protein
MITLVEATLVDGVLKPDESLPFADQTRVRLTIEPIGERSSALAQAAWDAIQARLRQRPIDSGGVRYTRDELHERH